MEFRDPPHFEEPDPLWTFTFLQPVLRNLFLAFFALALILTLRSDAVFECTSIDESLVGLFSWVVALGSWSLVLLIRIWALCFGPEPARQRPEWRRLLWLPLGVGFLALCAQYEVPVRVAFAVSRASFTSRLRQAGGPSLFSGVSVYPILEMQVDREAARFVVGHSEDILWTSTLGGFAYCPAGPSAYVFDMPEGAEGQGLVTYHYLDSGWYWWTMDLTDFAYN